MSRDVLARIIGKGWPEILLPQWGSFLRECIHLPKKNCVGVPDFLGCKIPVTPGIVMDLYRHANEYLVPRLCAYIK